MSHCNYEYRMICHSFLHASVITVPHYSQILYSFIEFLVAVSLCNGHRYVRVCAWALYGWRENILCINCEFVMATDRSEIFSSDQLCLYRIELHCIEDYRCHDVDCGLLGCDTMSVSCYQCLRVRSS
jgi:hypothetical protein